MIIIIIKVVVKQEKVSRLSQDFFVSFFIEINAIIEANGCFTVKDGNVHGPSSQFFTLHASRLSFSAFFPLFSATPRGILYILPVSLLTLGHSFKFRIQWDPFNRAHFAGSTGPLDYLFNSGPAYFLSRVSLRT